MNEQTARDTAVWPTLRVDEWTDTRDTLHMWAQIVGKIRMAHSPLVNHWWQVTLYVGARGLTTSPSGRCTELRRLGDGSRVTRPS